MKFCRQNITPDQLTGDQAACQALFGRKKRQKSLAAIPSPGEGEESSRQRTSINILAHGGRDRAPVRLGDALGLEAVAQQRGRVHGALERVALPAEDVVGVGAVAGAVLVAPDERLRPVLGPEVAVVERPRVPHGLERHVWHADRVRGRAGPVRHEAAPARVVHVVLVVGRVEVLAVPARREVVDRHDARRARLLGQLGRLGEPRHDVLQARVPEPRAGGRGRARAADRHAEALRVWSVPGWQGM